MAIQGLPLKAMEGNRQFHKVINLILGEVSQTRTRTDLWIYLPPVNDYRECLPTVSQGKCPISKRIWPWWPAQTQTPHSPQLGSTGHISGVLCQLCAVSPSLHRKAAPISWSSEHRHGNADLLQLLSLAPSGTPEALRQGKLHLFLCIWVQLPQSQQWFPPDAQHKEQLSRWQCFTSSFHPRSRCSHSYCSFFLVTFCRAFKNCAMNSVSP